MIIDEFTEHSPSHLAPSHCIYGDVAAELPAEVLGSTVSSARELPAARDGGELGGLQRPTAHRDIRGLAELDATPRDNTAESVVARK